jgi:copper chaperone CopZ
MLGFFLASSVQVNAQCENYQKEKDCDSKKVASVTKGDLKMESFTVQGNCSMCEARIEKAAKSLEGVKKASWNVDKDMLTVHYKKDKVKMSEVHKAIAQAGHDTSQKEATQKNYASLPGCCQYRDDK